MANHRQLRRDPKRGALRQLETINSHITSARPRAQATPKKKIHIKGRGQATDRVKNQAQNGSPGRRAHLDPEESVTSRARATPKDASNVRQPPRAMENTSQPKPVTGKRERPEETEEVQHSNKRSRMLTRTNHTRPNEEQQNLSTETPLNDQQNAEERQGAEPKKSPSSMTEEERMAQRAKRFALGAGAVKSHKPAPAKRSGLQNTAIATDDHVTKQNPESAVFANPAEHNKAPSADEPTAIAKESRVSKIQTTVIPGSPKPKPVTPSHLPSPSSSSHSSPSTKRHMPDDNNSKVPTPKKQRLDLNQNRLPTPEQNKPDSPIEPVIKKALASKPKNSTVHQRQSKSLMVQKSRNAYKIQKAAPVQANPELKLKFFGYDKNSVPILHSASIEHTDESELTEKPSLYLRQEALAMFRRKMTYSDMGRNKEPEKTGPTRIIDDCDLYLRESKVYVATERGLLLAADYFKLMDIPDTQPVRFNGRKPAWVKSAGARFHDRRVELSYEPLTEKQKELGFISLRAGNTVTVYERIPAPLNANGKVVNLAYGMQHEDRATGLFSYDHTCPMHWGLDDDVQRRLPDPNVINWPTFDYTALVATYREIMSVASTSKSSTPMAPVSPSASSENNTITSAGGITGNANGTALSEAAEGASKTADSLPATDLSPPPTDEQVPTHSDKAIEAGETEKEQAINGNSQEESQQNESETGVEEHNAPVNGTEAVTTKESSAPFSPIKEVTTAAEHGTPVGNIIAAPEPSKWAGEDQVDYDDDEL